MVEKTGRKIIHRDRELAGKTVRESLVGDEVVRVEIINESGYVIEVYSSWAQFEVAHGPRQMRSS